jgi:hypothetical protein
METDKSTGMELPAVSYQEAPTAYGKKRRIEI